MTRSDVYRSTLRYFFAPVAELLYDDESVTEVLINGANQVYCERHGKLEPVDRRFADEQVLLAAVRNLEVAVPLPPGMDYVPGSARPANVFASEDGLAFGPLPLMRSVKDAKGIERLQRVPVADYRFLLWRVPRIEAESSVLLTLRTKVTHPAANASKPAK